jgi:DNA (cytosine-5)-methyltransferase 1
MKILELFCGTKSFANVAKERGHEIFTVDIEKKFNPDLCKDIMDVKLEDIPFQPDIIWASPPCTSHSVMCNSQNIKKLPDMKLYGLIIFLKSWFKGTWVVENVKPYYAPLIKPTTVIDRHCFWSNFSITKLKLAKKDDWYIRRAQIPQLCEQHMVDFADFDVIKDVPEVHAGDKQFRRRQILRNCVNPKIGLHIFNCAFKEQQLQLR